MSVSAADWDTAHGILRFPSPDSSTFAGALFFFFLIVFDALSSPVSWERLDFRDVSDFDDASLAVRSARRVRGEATRTTGGGGDGLNVTRGGDGEISVGECDGDKRRVFFSSCCFIGLAGSVDGFFFTDGINDDGFLLIRLADCELPEVDGLGLFATGSFLIVIVDGDGSMLTVSVRGEGGGTNEDDTDG